METDILSALLIITGLAAMIPVLSNRLERIGIPIVVYEIVAGMIVAEVWPLMNQRAIKRSNAAH